MDEAGALIPAVNITLLNLSTAFQRHAITNDEGSYVVPMLPPGRYNMTVQRDGFTTVEIRNVVLNTGDQLALRIKLKVGEIGASVIIVEGPSSIQESAAIGTIVNRRFVENMPLNGRSLQSLFELTPGVVLTKTTFSEQGQFSANGQRADANYLMVDGVSANIGVSAGAAPGQSATGSLPALTVLGGTNNLVSVEALEEFRIQTATYAPEFGRTPGAQVSLVTRSGSNEFHGTVFNYFRHDALDANDWFANEKGLPRAPIRQNDFGGVVGGPIRKNRAFFFFSFEGLRLRQPQVATTEVPSLSAREMAPASMKPFLNAFSIPNGPNSHNGLAEFAATYSDPASLNATSIRADAVMSEKLTVFGRYNFAPSEATQRGSMIVPGFNTESAIAPAVALGLSNLSRARLETQTLTAGATLAINPRIISDLRVNWSRARGATSFSLDDFGGAIPPPRSLIFPADSPAGNTAFLFLLGGGLNSSFSVGKNVDNRQQQVSLVDTLTVVAGAHYLKFGVDYRRLTPIYDPPRYGQAVRYDGVTGSNGPIPGTALSGIAVSALVFSGAGPRQALFTDFSTYVQDSWRVTPRLTLTYGLRWELNPPPTGRNDHRPVTVQGLNDPATLQLAPRGTPLWQTTYNNFAPRISAAYQFSQEQGREIVLRAGLGIFYDLGSGQAAQGFGSVFPFVAEKRFFDVTFPLAPEQATPPPLTLAPPFGTIVAFDPHLQLPRTQEGSITLEQSLGTSQVLSLTYVAALGRRLLREDALVSPNPNFTLVRVTTNVARSSYHGMQIQFQRRLSKGLQALVSYNWSHSLDNGSSDALSRLRFGIVRFTNSAPSLVDRGPSDFDVRHSLTAAATYDLPSPRGAWVGNRLLRNWAIDAILRARTATPVNIITETAPIGNGLIVELQRPNLDTGVPLYLKDPAAPGGQLINRAAFRAPLPNMQGSLGYNALRGFGVSQLDLAVRREFALAEGLKLQIKAESFNVFNHPNFGNPINDLKSAAFGQSTQMFGRSLGSGGINGGLSPIYQIGGPRSTQLAVKLLF